MALSDLTPEEWLKRLINAHNAELPDLKSMDRYLEGTQPLSYMHPDLVRELEDRVRQVVINWPRLIVGSIEDRLTVEGFRLGGDQEADADLWDLWQANDLDANASLVHLDALALKRAFVIVGTNEDDAEHPLITPESALQVHGERDPRTRQLRAVVKRWSDDDTVDAGPKSDRATLYLADSTHQFVKVKGKWVEQDRDDHGLGIPPVVMFPNMPRIRTPLGVSELKDVIPLSDAACKIATDMMVSAEFHAMPRRWAIGMGPEDFVDEQGAPIGTWRTLAGRIWTTGPRSADENVQLGQFAEAELSNFHNTLNALARVVSAISALPPDFLGLATTNPPSADAIRASESRLVKRVERKQTIWGESWERVQRLAVRIRDGEWDPASRMMETIWRDPSTPTIAQKADAAVKLFSEGIATLRQAREDVGYSAAQIARMEADDEKTATDPLTAKLIASLPSQSGPPAPAPTDVPPLVPAGAGGS